MSFLEPLFLIGLLAAGLPLAIHLFNKRKAARRRFPAIALLIESNKRTARSVKVRQRLLLALRVGLLALLAMAMAKPFCLSDTGVTSSDRLPTAVVFVLDTSSSMQRGDWFKRAQRQLSHELDSLRPWDEAALVETSKGELVVDRLSNDHGAIVRAAKKLKPTSGPGDTTDALLRAKALLLGSQLYNRRVVLISDMAKGGFKPEALPSDGYGLELRVINVRGADEAKPKNFAITEVTYTQEGSAQEQLWRIDVHIQSYWDQPAKGLELRLELGGQLVAAGKLDELLPNQRAIYTFRHRYDGASSIDARVALVDADDYAPDNEHLFVFRPRARIKALIVNGEPNSIAYEDEAFFLTRALNPKRATESGIIPTVITAQGLVAGVELKDYDVIFLANLSRVSAEAAANLEAYVRDGGGLLLSMGDQVDVDAYNMTLGNLLPKPLRTLKRLTDRSDPDAPVKLTSLGATDHQHPIFRAFSLPGGDTLQSVQVYSYMLLEPTATTDAKTLISFKDNAPALLERALGKGRVMLWTSTLDYEWSDFPVSSTYLPLLHRMVLYLARRATSRGAKSFLVGVPARMELAGLAKERLILRAQGEGKAREVLEIQDGAVVFTPRELGVYKAWAEQLDEANPEQGVLEDLTFAVNVPISESELGELPKEQLQAWQSSPQLLEAKPKGLESQRRVNLWPKLLFVVTLLLLMETMLGTRRVVLQKLWALVRPGSTQVMS